MLHLVVIVFGRWRRCGRIVLMLAVIVLRRCCGLFSRGRRRVLILAVIVLRRCCRLFSRGRRVVVLMRMILRPTGRGQHEPSGRRRD
jgi:hypothetical protein